MCAYSVDRVEFTIFRKYFVDCHFVFIVDLSVSMILGVFSTVFFREFCEFFDLIYLRFEVFI